MIALIQRVQNASVTVANECISHINYGMLILLGVEATDSELTAEKLIQKILKFRMFSDDEGKMNLNIEQISGEILIVSQFTLVAETQKGNRPGFSRGATPTLGNRLYEHFITTIASHTQCTIQTGQFGADMQVSLVNDGPVTFTINME